MMLSTAIRTAGLKAVNLEGDTPFVLASALNTWLEARQGSERIMDIQYLHAPTTEGDPEVWVAMILYATQ